MFRARKRILVVDDNDVIHEVLKQFLGRAYVVETVVNASAALAIILRQPPDAIVMDVKMPGVDGISLLKSIREMGLQTPVFIITGYDSTAVALGAVENGATGYLPKPFDLLHLDQLIAQSVGSTPVSAA